MMRNFFNLTSHEKDKPCMEHDGSNEDPIPILQNNFQVDEMTEENKNIPDAMDSINILTIRKWEHRMIRWMDAYRDGKGTKEAQIQVKKFGSRKQTSHRRVYETVARAFD